MEIVLQVVLLCGTAIFSVYVINKVRINKLELQYTLIWLFTSMVFFILAIFPWLIERLALIIAVKDDVNALYLLIIFAILMILFSLTCSISDKSKDIQILIQEIGLLKNEVEDLKKKVDRSTDKSSGK